MKEKGMVVSVMRGSIYDGPGIRTTVFLKGCPLRCLWCHNPEGLLFKPQLGYFTHKCIGCKKCVAACNYNVHTFEDDMHHVHFERCTVAGACVSACPADALVIYGKPMSADEIMAQVLPDKPYYDASGGGITLSGGEPLAQYKFAKLILQAAKAKGIHTCMETSGFAPREHLTEIMAYVDLFLYDYKETSPQKHQMFTGVENQEILDNLDFLCGRNAGIIVRCPIIPGYNDTEEHFLGILRLKQKYPNLIDVEIMPYHNTGKTKEAAIHHKGGIEMPSATEEQKQTWRRFLDSHGGQGIIIN